ncbi:MAG: hypothetical protein KJ645_05210, partial [Planctomycetes bacterium]|nr:hypothetical protein [Planctomycetota bacterium]
MKKPVRVVKKLLLALLILMVLVSVLEGLARLVLGNGYPMNRTDPETLKQRLLNQHVISHLFQRHPDPKICFKPVPGSHTTFLGQNYTINAQGMRGPELSTEKPDGTLRIAMLGDSFVFGWGADDAGTIPVVMNDILTKDSIGPERYEVINCGVPGYHTGQMKERLLHDVLPLDPDLLVLMVTANDLVKECLHFDTKFEGLYTDFLPLPYEWKPFLWHASVGYRFLVMRHKEFMEGTKRIGGFQEEDYVFFHDQIQAIRTEAEKRGIGFFLVIIPMLENFNQYPYQEQHEEMHRRLAEFDYVDFLPRMHKYDVRDMWFQVYDHHLNAKANLAVARMILGEMAARGMVRLDEGALPEEPFMPPLYHSGDFLVADMDADPIKGENLNGAIFRISPDGKSISVFSADPMFREPLDMVFDPQGNLLVMDAKADPLEIGAQGAVFRVNRFSGRAEVVISSEKFGFPNSLVLEDDGRFFISDKEADPGGFGKTGVLWVYDPKTQEIELACCGKAFS